MPEVESKLADMALGKLQREKYPCILIIINHEPYYCISFVISVLYYSWTVGVDDGLIH